MEIILEPRRRLSQAEGIGLEQVISAEEIKAVVMQFSPDKAPGPDGFPARFFQKYWGIVGQEVVNVKNFGRKKGDPSVALNIDLKKAYDSMDWGFLQKILLSFGFSEKWISWVMECTSTANFPILCNGVPAGFVLASKGLRQGCSLSPLLFAFVTEYFSTFIAKAIEEGKMKRCNAVLKTGLSISHAFYADDLVMVVKADVGSIKGVEEVLQRFKNSAGLQKKDKLWIQWLQASYLNKTVFWLVVPKATDSAVWKHVLEVRDLMLDKVLFQVGDGNCFKLVTDPWCNEQSLIQLFGAARFKGVDRQTVLASIIDHGAWSITENLDFIQNVIQQVVIHEGPDQIKWKDRQFSLKAAWNSCRSSTQIEKWAGADTNDHLFTSCDFASRIWREIFELVHLQCPKFVSLNQVVDWFIQYTVIKSIKSNILCGLFAVTIWKIWSVRNNVLHSEIQDPSNQVVQAIIWDVIAYLNLSLLWTSTFEGLKIVCNFESRLLTELIPVPVRGCVFWVSWLEAACGTGHNGYLCVAYLF
ncbi:uncharacterized protein LOC132281892 [Cornus florida]|uniref:uncharacterized protein LOC132281892 n=1 Tax=Cornus florida TaxID=4283 RepID=UPI00289917F3|nr:uncharacterized protein LOC132281892 [Cornus florida]